MGTPAHQAAQAAEITGDAPESGSSPVSYPGDGAYKFYAPPEKENSSDERKTSADLRQALPDFPEDGNVAKLRSSPAAIKAVQNRSGSWSYRVTVTIAGQQRKKVFQSLAEAEELREIWENERIHGAAAARPKMTSLEKAQLKDAEAAVLVIKPTGFSLLQAAQLMAGFDQARLQDIQKALRLADGEPFSITDAVKFAMAQKLRTTDLSNISYEDALAACLKDKKNHISTAHYQRLSQRGRSFGEFIGPMMVREIPGAATHTLPRSSARHKNITGRNCQLWSRCERDRQRLIVLRLKIAPLNGRSLEDTPLAFSRRNIIALRTPAGVHRYPSAPASSMRAASGVTWGGTSSKSGHEPAKALNFLLRVAALKRSGRSPAVGVGEADAFFAGAWHSRAAFRTRRLTGLPRSGGEP